MRFSSLSVVLLGLLCACQPLPPTPDPLDPNREATSLLGEPLYPPELPPEVLDERETQLAVARAAWEADPEDEQAIIWYGRRLAYLGRYRDAVEVYSQGLAIHPDSYRILRHRGHRLITLRAIRAAILDLERAARLVLDLPDEVEADGQPNEAGIPRSTLKSNIWYHWGLALYLDGQFAEAARVYRQCMEYSSVNDDMTVATAHWLYMTLRRQGFQKEAANLLGVLRPDMEIYENHAYHQLLLMYRGDRSPLDLIDPEAGGDPSDLATAYGVANFLLYNAKSDVAAELLARILSHKNSWPAFGYLAAEVDVKRLGPFLFKRLPAQGS